MSVAEIALKVFGVSACVLIMIFGIGATWINLCFDKWVDEGAEDENEINSEDCGV